MPRKRKPTKLRLLEGNPGKRPLPQEPDYPSIADDEPPEWLGEEGRTEWARVLDLVRSVGLYTGVDRAILASYCLTWEQMVEAQEKVREQGTVIYTESGEPKRSPWVVTLEKSQQSLRLLCSEFGFSPASRSKVSLPRAEKSAHEKIQELISGE